MRNNNSKAKEVIDLVSALPYFSASVLFPVVKNKAYLKIILSRYAKAGKIMRLKKGLYVSRSYLDSLEKKNKLSEYSEFISGILAKTTYLSLDWVLYENNLLTESPKNFTAIALAKTAIFSNELGNFFYHKIRQELFLGYLILKKGEFTIFKATLAKALFDFLYLRKNSLTDAGAIEELRLNLENLKEKDWKELEKYVKLEKSKKMREIFDDLRKIK